MRTLNTSLTALLPILSLLVIGSFMLGATTLEEFAIALLVGLAAGAYSSIFIASPMLAILKEREPRFAAIRARLATGRPMVGHDRSAARARHGCGNARRGSAAAGSRRAAGGRTVPRPQARRSRPAHARSNVGDGRHCPVPLLHDAGRRLVEGLHPRRPRFPQARCRLQGHHAAARRRRRVSASRLTCSPTRSKGSRSTRSSASRLAASSPPHPSRTGSGPGSSRSARAASCRGAARARRTCSSTATTDSRSTPTRSSPASVS